MELQFYHSTPATTTCHEIKDSCQGYRRWQLQRTSDYFSNQIENRVLRRYPTDNLIGNNSAFSQLKDSRSSTMKDIVIPKPNRVCAQYSGQGLHHVDRWTNQSAFLRSDENGFIPPLFVTQNNKVQGISDKTTKLLLDNSYKHYRKPMDIGLPSPCKKHKVSGNIPRNDEYTASAFRAFKRTENNHQFSRIDERNRNLPPPPPLVKTDNKMRNDYESRSQEISESKEDILIRGSLPSQLRYEKCQPDFKHSLQASATILHYSKPSTRENTMEYQQLTGYQESYNPGDAKRKSMELVRNKYHCHHYNSHSTLSNVFPHISNSRNNATLQRGTPHAITHKLTRPYCEPHSGIPRHPDYHYGVSFSTTNTTLGFNKKHRRSGSPELLKCPSPTRIAATPQPFHDTHEAFHPGKQFISSSNPRVNNYIVVPDSLRNNSRKCLEHPIYQSRPDLEFSFSKESRLFKDHVRLEDVFHEIPECPGQKNKHLPFDFNHKIPQSPKLDGGKLLKHDGHLKNTRQPLIVPHKPLRHHDSNLNEIQRLPDTQSPGASSPSSTHKLKHVSEHLSSSLSSNCQMKGSVKDAMSSELSELASTPPHRRHSSFSYPFYFKPEASMGKSQNSAISQVEKTPGSAPNCDHLSFSMDVNENKLHKYKDGQSISPHFKPLRSPPNDNLQILDCKKATKETENQSTAHKAFIKQKNQPVIFQRPLKPRRLSYPCEKTNFNDNHSKTTPNGCLRRTVNEYDKNSRRDTEFSQLLDNCKDEKNASNPCGGYAFDHDSLPIIVAVHSVMVEDKKTQEIESSQEEETKKGTSKEETATPSSPSTDDTESTPTNEQESYQKPTLLLSSEKPDTSEPANPTMEIEVSGENQKRNQNVSTTDEMDEKPVNTVSTESCNKNTTQKLKSVSVLHSNELLEEKEDKAIRIEEHYVTFVNDVTTNVCTEKSTREFSQLIGRSAYEEIETNAKTPKPSLHRRQSVEELSNKIMETMERIDKEEIEWKKKLLHRLKFVLVKKLKKAERHTGVKASIDLPSEINVKGKEEQKKAKNCKRNKCYGDDPDAKGEQAEKDIKEKCDDTILKESDYKSYEAKIKVHMKKPKCVLKTELGNIEDNEKNTCKKVGQKISSHYKKMNKDEINEMINEDTPSRHDEVLITNGNDRKVKIITGNYNESLLFLNSERESDSSTGLGYCELVIDE